MGISSPYELHALRPVKVSTQIRDRRAASWLGEYAAPYEFNDEDEAMSLNPPTQYLTDANLRARQRLWQQQQPPFDIVSWVLDAAALRTGVAARVLDVGCGNGAYLSQLRDRGAEAVGCDFSRGMLAAAAPHPKLVNADVTALPFSRAAFDVVLAPHMLYHVADREAAASEMRRVLRPGGCCVVVTNGKNHMRALRILVESAVRVATPGWEMRNPSTHEFSLDNGEELLRTAFRDVTSIRPRDVAPVVLTDAVDRSGLRRQRRRPLSAGDHTAVARDRRGRSNACAARDRLLRRVRRPRGERRVHL